MRQYKIIDYRVAEYLGRFYPEIKIQFGYPERSESWTQVDNDGLPCIAVRGVASLCPPQYFLNLREAKQFVCELKKGRMYHSV